MHKIDEIQCSLEKTSLDDRYNVTKEYMTHSQLRVCAFDDVKKWYVREKIPFANPNPKSNDALYFEEDECFFIEFKNGRITDQVNFEINKKIYDIIHFLRREMLDFTAFPVFFVSNLLLVQRKKYYFNRAMVSRNCSIVL